MSFEDELERRLAAQADSVNATPDLAAVESGARRRRARRRGAALAGAVAVLAGGVGGILVVSSGGDDRVVSTADTTPVESDAGVIVPATDAPPGMDGPAATDPPTPATVPPLTVPPATPTSESTDPVEQYFDRSVEVYRRTLPTGVDAVVRRSTGSHAELFGYQWVAPTGSAERCLPEYGLLFGLPGVPQSWGSAWGEVGVSSGQIEDLMVLTELDEGGGFTALLVATEGAATELLAESADGVELDRAPIVDGVAVVRLRNRDTNRMTPDQSRLVPLIDGERGAARTLAEASRLPRGFLDPPEECRPPDPPQLGLPPAGERPADPARAEAEIRARHALLVDRSIADDERPDDLLDDATGVAEARDEVNAGPFAESAAAAEYTIEEVVFTSPTEAWFGYTIDAPTGEFEGRFGRARFNGEVWQITRATICQDLALAAGTCQPPPVPANVEPPLPPDWDEQLQAYYELSRLYSPYDGCGLIPACLNEADILD